MRVLIAYDGSECADAAIEDLRRAGLPVEADAHVLSVADGAFEFPAEAEALAGKGINQLRTNFPGWTISPKVAVGPAARAILDMGKAWPADLIVAGSHGRSSVERLVMGSVSMELIHKATCSVRVVRTAGKSAPEPIRIVIGNDGSPEADAVIRAVGQRAWPDKTEVCVLSVVETLVPHTGLLEASTFAHDQAYLVIREADEHERTRLAVAAEKAVAYLRQTGLQTASVVVDGDPRQEILAEARRRNVDAIFVGARGLGRLNRLFLGSVSTYVLSHAHCTVEVVRQS